jgi:hypothetical protein
MNDKLHTPKRDQIIFQTHKFTVIFAIECAALVRHLVTNIQKERVANCFTTVRDWLRDPSLQNANRCREAAISCWSYAADAAAAAAAGVYAAAYAAAAAAVAAANAAGAAANAAANAAGAAARETIIKKIWAILCKLQHTEYLIEADLVNRAKDSPKTKELPVSVGKLEILL